MVWNTETGDPIPGVYVYFNIYSGGGSLYPTSGVTNSLGKTSVTFTSSTSEGFSTITARTAGGTGTSTYVTCYEVEILQPSSNADFDISQNNYTTTSNITFQARILPSGVSGTISWELTLEYQTSGGYGSGSDYRTFQTQSNEEHTEIYSSKGGRITVKASTSIAGSSYETNSRYITVTGVAIPDSTITSRLKALYDSEPGGTDSICCGIASKESSYLPFDYRTLYGR